MSAVPATASDELVALTHRLAEPGLDLVILAEGNTSELVAPGRIVVKASGSYMATATAADFVAVMIDPLIELLESEDATQADVTAALDAGSHDGTRMRGSIETLVHGIVAISDTAAGAEAVSLMAVKAARVRLAALAAGGVVPLDPDAVAHYWSREDLAERRASLSGS